MTNAYEIDARTSESAASHSGSVDTPVAVCRDWVRVVGRYSDRWRTPMAGAEFKLYINNALVLEGETLKDYDQVGLTPGHAPQTDAEREAYEELGTFLHRCVEPGEARAELVRDEAAEPEIEELREAIEAGLDGAYRALREKMRPYQEQWDRYGYLSIPLAQAQGLAESGQEWLEGLTDVFTIEYWSEVGEGLSNAFSSTLGLLEEAGAGAARLGERIWENRGNLIDGSWWTQQAEDVVSGAQQSAEELRAALVEGADALGRSAEAAAKVYEHREAIMQLPNDIVAGRVDKIEEFIDTALQDIDPEMAEQLRYDQGWQANIELLHDGEAAATVMVYLNLFLTAAPPNFWSHAQGRIGFYIMIEIVLLIIGLLLGGAGAAARVAVISARIARMTATAGRAGQMADRALDAARAAARMLDALKDAIRDVDRLKDKLLRARRRSVSRGRTNSTLRHRRDNEERDGRCRVCGNRGHNTPIPRRGEVDYI